MIDKSKPLVAPTLSGPKPGDFPVGSMQSRAAARSLLEHRGHAGICSMFVYNKPKNSKLLEDKGRCKRVMIEPAEGAEKPFGQTDFEGAVYEVYGDPSCPKLYPKVGTEHLPNVRLAPAKIAVRVRDII